jgi:hypothetical protein
MTLIFVENQALTQYETVGTLLHATDTASVCLVSTLESLRK